MTPPTPIKLERQHCGRCRGGLLLTMMLMSAAHADDPDPVPSPAAAGRALDYPPVPVITAASPKIVAGTAEAVTPIAVMSQARWAVAGYNNEELIYTVVLTSHDPRIVRCLTRLRGTSIENDQKTPITDQQITTVFPEQSIEVGNWVGLDQASGATYSVTCHPLP